MGLGSLFGKPSRRYASTSSSSYAYDPAAGYYPTPLDDTQSIRGGYAASTVSSLVETGGGSRRPRGSAASDIGTYGASSSSKRAGASASKKAQVTSRDYGFQPTGSSGLLSVPSAAKSNSRKALVVPKSPRRSGSGTMSDIGVSPSRRPLGSFVDDGASETSSIYSHRSSLTVSGTQSLLTSSAGASALLSKRDRKRRTLEVQGRAQVFSAADLAPPPPKPLLRRNPSTVPEEDEGVEDGDAGRPMLPPRRKAGSVMSADEIANSAREATALHVSQSRGVAGGSQVGSATSSQSFAPRSSVSSGGGGRAPGSSRSSSSATGSKGAATASPPVSSTQPMVMIREESRETASLGHKHGGIDSSKPPQAPFAGYDEHGQLTPPNSDRGGIRVGPPRELMHQRSSSSSVATPETIASPVSASSVGSPAPVAAAPVVTPPALIISELQADEGSSSPRHESAPSTQLSLQPETTSHAGLPPTAEELMRQHTAVAAPVKTVPESPSQNTLFGSADSHDGSNASLASPETPAGQIVGGNAAQVAAASAGDLAPPVLSIQPPTPMQDHDATPFHGDRIEAPALPTRGTPPSALPPRSDVLAGTSSMPELGAPIGANVHATDAAMPPPPVPANASPVPANSSPVPAQTAPASQDPTRPPPLGSLPAPADPNQPHVLKWDPSLQMWTMVPEQQQPHVSKRSPSRAASVVSSVSTYSQQSGMPGGPHYTASRDRRQSLPQLATNVYRPQPMRAPSPSPLTSRPASPASMGLTSPPPSMYGGARRMSIEPAYSIAPTTLTLVPEMKAQNVYPDRPASRSHSRASSVHESQWGGSDAFDRIGQSALAPSLSRYRMSMSPSRMDSASRPSDSAPVSRSPSESGDEHDHQVPSRPGSAMGSRYAPSLLGGESVMSGSQAGRRRKAGRESALDTMSTRGDSVPLQGADGLDQPTSGYTSLVLPVGSYRPSDPLKTSNKLDPRVTGMPHAAMSTITLSPSAASLSRKSSRTGLFKHESPTPAHLLADLPPPVSFSSHQAPPAKISDSQVLVQVYAVALDRFDSDMVHELSGAGKGIDKWVPGRSFVGRALEVGADVRVIAKGDLVMGVTDIKKSGTLAEFITCERRRIARTPHGSHLSLEQLACLPLYGITAHRACVGLTRGGRALVLNAHEGVGALVTQELSTMGVHVIAQVPTDVAAAEDDAWENGAKEVVADHPVVMINAQHEGSFDLFVDTEGGRRVYDAARRVLRSAGA